MDTAAPVTRILFPLMYSRIWFLSRLMGSLVSSSSIFTSFISILGDSGFIQPSGALVDSGPFDLIAYDHEGMMVWIFCIQGTIDADDIGKIISPVLNQKLEEFKGISSIYMVAHNFSWVAKELLKKYKGIVIREGEKTRTIPFKLWIEEKETEKFEIKFKSII